MNYRASLRNFARRWWESLLTAPGATQRSRGTASCISVARLYGAYQSDAGVSERALFVIDADGIIRWSYLSPVGINPGADGILDALDALDPKQRGDQT
jgi:peroxiredoxin